MKERMPGTRKPTEKQLSSKEQFMLQEPINFHFRKLDHFYKDNIEMRFFCLVL